MIPMLTNFLDGLQEGDLILTGTPSGVGPILPGDRVECTLSNMDGEQLSSLYFDAVKRKGNYRFVD